MEDRMIKSGRRERTGRVGVGRIGVRRFGKSFKVIALTVAVSVFWLDVVWALDPRQKLLDDAEKFFEMQMEGPRTAAIEPFNSSFADQNESFIDSQSALQELESANQYSSLSGEGEDGPGPEPELTLKTDAGDLLHMSGGEISRITRADGTVLAGLVFDASGRMTDADLRLGDGTLQLVRAGSVNAARLPDGTNVFYGEDGRIERAVTPDGRETLYAHALDAAGNVTRVTVTTDEAVSQYDADGRILESVFVSGKKVFYNEGILERVEEGGRVIRYAAVTTTDADGKTRVSISIASGGDGDGRVFETDAGGVITAVTEADGTRVSGIVWRDGAVSDAIVRLASGEVREYRDGRLTRSVDAAGVESLVSYTADRVIVNVVQTGRVIEYDAFSGAPIRLVSADGSVTEYLADGIYAGYAARTVSASGAVTIYEYSTDVLGRVGATRIDQAPAASEVLTYTSTAALKYTTNPALVFTAALSGHSAASSVQAKAYYSATANVVVTLKPGAASTAQFGKGAAVPLGVTLTPGVAYTTEIRWTGAAGIGIYVYPQGSARPAAPRVRFASYKWNPKFSLVATDASAPTYVPSAGVFTRSYTAGGTGSPAIAGQTSARTVFRFASAATTNKVILTAKEPAAGLITNTFTATWLSGRWTLVKSAYNSSTKKTVTTTLALAQALTAGVEYAAALKFENGKIALYSAAVSAGQPTAPVLSTASLSPSGFFNVSAVNALVRTEITRRSAADAAALRASARPDDADGHAALVRIAIPIADPPEIKAAEYLDGALERVTRADGTTVEFSGGLLRRADDAEFFFEESAYGNLAAMTIARSGLKTAYDAKGRLRSIAAADESGVEQTVFYEDGRVTRIEKADGTDISDIVFDETSGSSSGSSGESAGAAAVIRDAVVRTADGSTRRYVGGKIIEETKSDGTVTDFEDGRPAVSRMADGRVYVYRVIDAAVGTGIAYQMTLSEYADDDENRVKLDETTGVPFRIDRADGGIWTDLVFGANGVLTGYRASVRDAMGAAWELRYADGRIVEAQSEPTAGSTAEFGQEAYYEDGRLTRLVMEDGKDLEFTYSSNAHGELNSIRVVSAAEGIARVFGASGGLISYESPEFTADFDTQGVLRILMDRMICERPVFDAQGGLVSARILTEDGMIYEIEQGRLVRTIRHDGVTVEFDTAGLVTRMIEGVKDTTFEYLRDAAGVIQDIHANISGDVARVSLPDFLKSGPNPGYWPVKNQGGWHYLNQYSQSSYLMLSDGRAVPQLSRPFGDTRSMVYSSSALVESHTADRLGIQFGMDNLRPIAAKEGGFLFVKLRIENAPELTQVRVRPGATYRPNNLGALAKAVDVEDGLITVILPVTQTPSRNIEFIDIDFIPAQSASAVWTVAVEQAGYFELDTEQSRAHEPFLGINSALDRISADELSKRLPLAADWPERTDGFNRFTSAGDKAVRMTIDGNGSAQDSLLADGSIHVYTDGKASAVTAPDGTVTEYIYDADGKVARTRVIPASDEPIVTHYAYGKIREVTTDAGETLYRYAYEFEGDNEITVITDARSGDVKRYSDGKILSSIDNQGLLTTYVYEASASAVNNEPRIVSSEVTWKGRTLHRFTYSYAPGETRVTGEDGVTKIYNEDGRLAFIETAAGLRYKSSDLTDGSGDKYEEHALYSAKTEDGVTLFYKEDTVERIVLRDGTVLDIGEEDGVYRNVLLKEGLVDEVTHEDGSTARYLRDEIGRLTAVDLTRAQKTYRYNAAGELIRMIDLGTGEVSEYGMRKDEQGRVTHTRVIRRIYSDIAGLDLKLPVRAASYGYMDGWNSSVTVDGTDHSEFNYDLLAADQGFLSRGWSVVHVDAQGNVVNKGFFDPYFKGSQEADRMAAFLESIPAGDLAVMAVADEGSKNLTADAVTAIEYFGSSLIKGLGYRDSFALIGRKGAAPGSAIEDLNKLGEGAAIVSNADTQIFYYDAEGKPVSYADYAQTPEMSWDTPHKFQQEGDIETFASIGGTAAGWKKNFAPEHPDSGFVYLWGGVNDPRFAGSAFQADYEGLAAHAAEKYVYYDPGYFSNYTDADPNSSADDADSFTEMMKERLVNKGYQIVTAADLKTFFTTKGKDTALFMLQSVMPETVYDPMSPYSLGSRNIPREYMEAGGTIIWTHDLPFYYVARADGSSQKIGEAGLRKMLGVIPVSRQDFEWRRTEHAQSFDQDLEGYRLIGAGAAHETGWVRLSADPEALEPVTARLEASFQDNTEEENSLLSNLMRSVTVELAEGASLETGLTAVTFDYGQTQKLAVRFDADGRLIAYSSSNGWFWTGFNHLPGVSYTVEFHAKGDFTELYVYPASEARPLIKTAQIVHPRFRTGVFYAESQKGEAKVLETGGYLAFWDKDPQTATEHTERPAPQNQPGLDINVLNYDTNVNFRQVSWSAIKSQVGNALESDTPIVSTYDADSRLVSVARADRTVLVYKEGSDRLDAVYDLSGNLLTEYVYGESGDLIEVRNVGQRRALDEALFDAKKQVSIQKAYALQDQATEAGLITQSFLDQVNAQRSQFDSQRSSVQNSLNDLENQKMKGSAAKKAKSEALDQLRDALRQIDQARNAFEEDVARQLSLLSGALNEKKLSLERDFTAAFTQIDLQLAKSLDVIALEEKKAVVIDLYRTHLGRDPTDTEAESGMSSTPSVLKSFLLSSPDHASRTARRSQILSSLKAGLDEFLSASEPQARAAFLNTLGLTGSEAVDLSSAEVAKLKSYLDSQSLHMAESAIDPLVELLEAEGQTFTESDRTLLAARLILIDILTGQVHPFLKEGEELLISLYALEKTSQLYNKSSSGLKLTYEDLIEFSQNHPSKRPVVHVEGRHYVNLVQATQTEVTILDGGEVKKLSKEDFLKVWEGTTLLPDAHAPPATLDKKLSSLETRNIKGAFFFLIPAIIGAIGSITAAIGGIIASIGSILAGIGTLIGNIALGLGNILTGVLHGIGTLTQALFTGLKFAGTHLFGGGLTSLFAPATQGGFFGLSLNSITATSLFNSAVSIGLNYGLQRGLDALGVNPGISSVLTGFITGGFLGGISPTGFNSALFLESGLKGAVQAGSRSLLAASGLDSSVANIITTLSAPASQNGSWQTTIGGQLITINPTLVQDLASYGIQKLGSTIGLDPSITRLIGSSVMNAMGSILTPAPGASIVSAINEVLTHAAVEYGVRFAVEKMSPDNPLLQSLSATVLTKSVASLLDPNGNILKDLLTGAEEYTSRFIRDLGTVDFQSLIAQEGLVGALEARATHLFSQGALEEIHGMGGIANLISGRAVNIDLNGRTVTEVKISASESFLMDNQGNLEAIKRDNVFYVGRIETTVNGYRLMDGQINTVNFDGSVSTVTVKNGMASSIEVFSGPEGESIIRITANQLGVFTFSGAGGITDGHVSYNSGAWSAETSNGQTTSISEKSESRDDDSSSGGGTTPGNGKKVDYTLLNGIRGSLAPEGTPTPYFDPEKLTSFVGSLQNESVSREKVDVIALFEDMALDPLNPFKDLVGDMIQVLTSPLGLNKEVRDVRTSFRTIHSSQAENFVPIAYSGGGQPLLKVLNEGFTNKDGVKEPYNVETAVLVGSPILFNHIDKNTNLKRIINIYGQDDEFKKLNLIPKSFSGANIEVINIELTGGVHHMDYFFDPDHPNQAKDITYYADAFIAKVAAAAIDETSWLRFSQNLPKADGGIIKLHPSTIVLADMSALKSEKNQGAL